MVYIHNRVIDGFKKNEIMSFSGKKWMEVEIIRLNGISQTQKYKYGMFSSDVES
jgi:hypothetical protein